MEVLGIIAYSFVSVFMDVIDLLIETFKIMAYIITLAYMLNLIRKDIIIKIKRKKINNLRQKEVV